VSRRTVFHRAVGLTVLGGAAASAAGCEATGTGGGAGRQASQEPVRLQLMTWITDREWVPRFWQGYTQQNPRATVEVNILDGGGNAGDDKFLVAAAGGAPPDLFWTGRSSVAEWGIDGVVGQLDERLKNSRAIRRDGFIPKAIEEGGWRGKTYGLYYSADTRILYWNKEHLTAAGVDPEKAPDTWDALATAIPRLVKRSGPDQIERLAIHPTYDSVGAHYWEAWYWALGGQYLNPETLQVTFVNEQAVQALEWMKRQADLQGGWGPLDAFWQNATAATPNRQAGWGLGGERVSLFIETGDVVTSMAQYYPQIKYGLGEIPAAPTGKRGSVRGGFFWVLPTGTKQPDASWAFLEWAFGRAPMLEYNDHFNRIPTTQEVLSSPEYTRGGEVRRVLQKVVAYSQRIPAIVPGYAEILTINGRFPTEVLSGQKAPREALEGAAREIQAVLDKWKGRA
jgi:multiple sugar transport system substrate-binding protein